VKASKISSHINNSDALKACSPTSSNCLFKSIANFYISVCLVVPLATYPIEVEIEFK